MRCLLRDACAGSLSNSDLGRNNRRSQHGSVDARDASEIAVRAIPVIDAKGVTVKLNIDAAGLGLTQEDDRWTD